jgi:DNA-directed RNA polymerase subunit RPC12/RpoP
MIRVACRACGYRGVLEHRPAEVQQLVAIDVGHVMPTLGVALAHIVCPECAGQGLHIAGGSNSLQAGPPTPPAAHGGAPPRRGPTAEGPPGP